MTEYFTVKRIDNSRLLRPAPTAQLRDFWRRVATGTALTACLLFYAWQHFECIQIRYQIEQLSSEHAQAAELNQQLHLEVATLRSPMRVDGIARNQLGLTVPVPGQVAPVEGPSDSVLADARPVALSPRP
jgi:cell division protein FtsL